MKGEVTRQVSVQGRRGEGKRSPKTASRPCPSSDPDDVIGQTAHGARHLTKAGKVVDVDDHRSLARRDQVEPVDMQAENLSHALGELAPFQLEWNELTLQVH